MSKEEVREDTPSEVEPANIDIALQEVNEDSLIEDKQIEIPPVKLDPVTDLYHLIILSWSGQCTEGVPHGFGQLVFRSGAIYTGSVEYGLMHGKGEIKLKSGWTYAGDFYKNSIEGFGKITFPDEAEYEGDVVAGYRHGVGHFQKGATSYSGQWKAGKRHGHGLARWSSVSFYDGDWQDDKCHGYGIRQWSNLDVYKGTWSNGVREGNGHMVWHEEGQEYDGQWRRGLQEGTGTGTWKGNKLTTYTGGWFQGQRFGKGTMKYGNGSVYEGNWRKDQKSGQAYITRPTGKLMIAYFDNDRVLDNARNINEFHSVTELQIIETLGDTLADGAPSVIRNVGHIRRLYQRYSSLLPDHQFRLFYIDRICIDYNIVDLTPIINFYPPAGEKTHDPNSPILFREFCFFMVNIANVLWPAEALDEAVQRLFDEFLCKPVQYKGLLFSEDFRDLITPLHSLWSSLNYSMTARDFIQLIQKLELPFTPTVCVEVLSKEDANIAENIERNISFVQFAEALIALIIRHKDMEIKAHSPKDTITETLSKTSSPNEIEPKEKQSNTDSKTDDYKTSVTSIKSGSLLQTISELSDQPKNEHRSQCSTDEVSNIRLEVFQYIQERVMSAWTRWRKICDIITQQEMRRLDKESKVYDLSNLIVTTKLTSRSVSTHSHSLEA